MNDVRLIERWLPIAEIGIESTRERTPMMPFPAPNRRHVRWARRPLVASRAAVLASPDRRKREAMTAGREEGARPAAVRSGRQDG